ncbi:MAG: nucleoside phosphorylase [Bacteroidales bacterium]|nr:nucleoside phosphorylase [Bacteroidales bacterium]
MKKLKNSQLIINPEGTIYHMDLRPENIADTIILVGDPQRVPKISKYFDKIEFKNQNREIITHTGYFNGKKLSVISTGMGTDNIDIVLNELDALVNIDLKKRVVKDKHTPLNIIRLGTSGAIQKYIEIDSFAVSKYGLGLDGLLGYYKAGESVCETEMLDEFFKQTNWPSDLSKPYFVKCSEDMLNKIGDGMIKGITATAPGFYAPQGRALRLNLKYPDIIDKIGTYNFKGEKVINFEMETSALYGLGQMLEHNVLTVCAVIANRITEEYSKDHQKTISNLIEIVLERLCAR